MNRWMEEEAFRVLFVGGPWDGLYKKLPTGCRSVEVQTETDCWQYTVHHDWICKDSRCSVIAAPVGMTESEALHAMYEAYIVHFEGEEHEQIPEGPDFDLPTR